MVATARLEQIEINEDLLLEWAKDYPRLRLWVLTYGQQHFVIRAETEKKARELASQNAGIEWLDNALCFQLMEDGITEIIVKGYNS